jgi:ribonuclease HII
MKTHLLYEYDRNVAAEISGPVAGIDEAGRGPLAGPVVAAAVILDTGTMIPGVNDSKKLSPEKREKLYGMITANALSWAAGQASVEEIETFNILQATFLAMQRALDAITIPWAIVLVDGNQPIPGVGADRQRTIVKGDGTSAAIAAASIIAKVTRDRILNGYHEKHPQYDFPQHKGYGTGEHCLKIRQHGLCEHHRPSFCRNILASQHMI